MATEGPSREALAAAAELDVALDQSPTLALVVEDMLRPESLPEGWEARWDEDRGRREYVHLETGEVRSTHPLVAYYRGAAFMETGGFQQLTGAEAEHPPNPQEVLDMCAYLGVATEEDPYVVEVARMAISAPLPPHWEEGEDEAGNPVFINHETGETQPSHPLDPYFLELISRRRRELMLRTDGVGIRSALAAKRLNDLGMPGVAVPAELQEEDEEEAAAAAAAAAEAEAEVEAIHGEGFGALVTIREEPNEGVDEDEDGPRGPLDLPPPAFGARGPGDGPPGGDQEPGEQPQEPEEGREEGAEGEQQEQQQGRAEPQEQEQAQVEGVGAVGSRPATGRSQRPATGQSQRPGTQQSQRPGTAMSPRPGSALPAVPVGGEDDDLPRGYGEGDDDFEGPGQEQQREGHVGEEQDGEQGGQDDGAEQAQQQEEEEQHGVHDVYDESEGGAGGEVQERGSRPGTAQRVSSSRPATAQQQDGYGGEGEGVASSRPGTGLAPEGSRGSRPGTSASAVGGSRPASALVAAAVARVPAGSRPVTAEMQQAHQEQPQQYGDGGSRPATATGTQGSRPGTATAASRPATANRPATAEAYDSRPATANRPATAEAPQGSRPGTAVANGSRPVTATNRPTTAEVYDSRPATANRPGTADVYGSRPGTATRPSSAGPSEAVQQARGSRPASAVPVFSDSPVQPQPQRRSTPGGDDDEPPPTLSSGIANLAMIRATASVESRISETAERLPDPPATLDRDSDTLNNTEQDAILEEDQVPADGQGGGYGDEGQGEGEDEGEEANEVHFSPDPVAAARKSAGGGYAGEGAGGEEEYEDGEPGTPPWAGARDAAGVLLAPPVVPEVGAGGPRGGTPPLPPSRQRTPPPGSAAGMGPGPRLSGSNQQLMPRSPSPPEFPRANPAPRRMSASSEGRAAPVSVGEVSAGGKWPFTEDAHGEQGLGVEARGRSASVNGALPSQQQQQQRPRDLSPGPSARQLQAAGAVTAPSSPDRRLQRNLSPGVSRIPKPPDLEQSPDRGDGFFSPGRLRASPYGRSLSPFAAHFPPGLLPPPGGLRSGGGGEEPWGSDLRRTRSFSEIETGKLRKQMALLASAGAVGMLGTAGPGAGGAGGAAGMPGFPIQAFGSRGADAGGELGALPPKPPARERIRVAVRARPLMRRGEVDAWVVDPNTCTVRLKEGMVTRNPAAERVHVFDQVLGPEATTRQLWTSHVAPLMEAAVGGINTTVFAYGQTGSGKSYTMFGHEDSPGEGIIGMSLTYIFQTLQEQLRLRGEREEYVLKVSMLELYNETLRDLIAPPGPLDRFGRPTGPNQLLLQDDLRTGVKVTGLLETPVEDMRGAMALVNGGYAARSTGATAMNEVSSRSHTIVRVALETREAVTHDLLHTSLISFVDLAGSERLTKTGATGARFTEGTSINISLLMLGTVVARLAEGKAGKEFIPYRNSKLTRLLQPCLGGNSKTAIIAVFNPSTEQLEETFNTLHFATRAMNVVNQVSVNRFVKGGAQVAALQKQVAALKAELAAARKGRAAAHGGFGGGGGGGGLGEGPPDAGLLERVRRLELDKAQLLDRLETMTGQPVGDIYDELPPPPPDLKLPAARPRGALAGGVAGGVGAPATAALRSIARVVCMGKAGAGAGAAGGNPLRQSEHIPAEEVVMLVREMRAERDELRKRDAALRSQLDEARGRAADADAAAGLRGAAEEAINMIESLLGPSPLSDPVHGGSSDHDLQRLAERLAENVSAVVLMHNEFSSMQRQLVTAEGMAAAANRRAEAAEAALQDVARAAAARHAARKPEPRAEHAEGEGEGDEEEESEGSGEEEEDGEGEGARSRAPGGEAQEQGDAGGDEDELRALVSHLDAQLSTVRLELEAARAELRQLRGLQAPLPPGLAAAAEAAQLAAAEGDPELQQQLAAAGAVGGGEWAAEAADGEIRGPAAAGALATLAADGSAAAGGAAGAGGEEAVGVTLLTPEALNVGGFALRRAREAMAQAAALEKRCLAAEAERDELRERLQALEEAVEPAQAANPRASVNSLPGGVRGSVDAKSGLNASMGGTLGAARFQQLKAHVGSLSREVAALTKERDSLLAIVLKMQGPAVAGAGLQLDGYGDGDGMGGPGRGGDLVDLSGSGVFSSVPSAPVPAGPGHGPGPGGRGGAPMSPGRGPGGGAGRGRRGAGAWESEPSPRRGGSPMRRNGSPMRRNGSPSKARAGSPGRGGLPPPVPHMPGWGDRDRPDFNPRASPMDGRARRDRQRDRQWRLDGEGSPLELGVGGVGLGLGPLQGEALGDGPAQRRNGRNGGGPGGARSSPSPADVRNMQAALAAAGREAQEQSKAYEAHMRNLEEAHEEDLSVVRTEAAGVIKSLMDENARLKLAMALSPNAGPAGAGPGDVAPGLGGVRGGSAGAVRPTGSGGGVGVGPLPFGPGAGVQFSLKAMGAGLVGSSGGSSPGGMARASPVRAGSLGSNHGGGMGVNSPGGGGAGGNGLVLPPIPQSRNGSRSGQRR